MACTGVHAKLNYRVEEFLEIAEFNFHFLDHNLLDRANWYEGVREGGREGGEGGREGDREGDREGGREGEEGSREREGGREGGREREE